MEACINTNSAEFRALQERSGLSEFDLKVAIGAYLEAREGKWPQLDEIPNANSQSNLEESLKLDKNGGTKVANILEATGTLNLDEAVIKINNLHRDLNTEILPLKEEAIVTIEKRPSPYELRQEEPRDFNEVNSRIFIGQALLKLAKGFGIQTIYKSTKELEQEGILDKVPEGVHVAAFVLDGNIVVNSDIASVDAPVHELLHVLMGSLKFTNPEAYMQLVSQATNLACFNDRAALYKHRSQSDVFEEVFVSEYAKFLSGINNGFENLGKDTIYQINYEISRNLDTILNGDNSVRVLPQAMRFGSSLRQLGKIVNSKDMEPQYQGYADSAYVSRIIGNIKQELFKNSKLEEICD